MIPSDRIPTHPGEILRDDFLVPLGISRSLLADELGVPLQCIDELVGGERAVTPEAAWMLAGALGTTPELWTNLQVAHDLARVRPELSVRRVANGR